MQGLSGRGIAAALSCVHGVNMRDMITEVLYDFTIFDNVQSDPRASHERAREKDRRMRD